MGEHGGDLTRGVPVVVTEQVRTSCCILKLSMNNVLIFLLIYLSTSRFDRKEEGFSGKYLGDRRNQPRLSFLL